MPAETEKERALEAIKALPEGATMDDAIERLCFIAKIEEGFDNPIPVVWSVTTR
jgi:hypothetical protein